MMYIIVVNKRKGLEQRQIRRKDKLTNTGHNIKLNARLNNNILYKSIIQSTQNTHTYTQFKTSFATPLTHPAYTPSPLSSLTLMAMRKLSKDEVMVLEITSEMLVFVLA